MYISLEPYGAMNSLALFIDLFHCTFHFNENSFSYVKTGNGFS